MNYAHSSLPLVACCLLIGSPVAAQNKLEPNHVYPIHAPVLDAGIYDLATRTWTSRGQGGAVQSMLTAIYDNTCTWNGGTGGAPANFLALESCEDLYDEGRIPSSTSVGPAEDNHVSSIEIGYCTPVPTGLVDINLAFWNNYAGACVGGFPPTPDGAAPIGYIDLGAAAGFPLPGATTAGTMACYTATIALTSADSFDLQSDGDAVFDADPMQDDFTWRIRFQNSQAQGGGLTGGPIISGEPSTSGGSCTYSVPCGVDTTFGNPCGTGLDTEDAFWINVDDCKIGAVPPTGCSSLTAGTNCYWFGGYPTNPFSSVFLRLEGDTCSTCCDVDWPLNVVPGSGSLCLDLDVKSQVVAPSDKVSWRVSNALAHSKDTLLQTATTLRITFTGTNPTTGPATTLTSIPPLGGAGALHCAEISSSATLGANFYDIELLDQTGVVMCIIDPVVYVAWPPTVYCTAKVNSLGCTPVVSAAGKPKYATCASANFTLTASSLIGNKNGLWFYGTNGLSGVAFQGGHLCVKPAIKRLVVQNSGGTAGACDGTISTNFNARICSGSDAALTAGSFVATQCWSRDPASPSTTNLTDAIYFTVLP